jgi:S-adenosylmethionine:tRNA ribosyltransferase-isomerase
VIISPELTAEITREVEDGMRVIKFHCDCEFSEILEKLGKTPLPPYITREAEERDKKTYQTVYAQQEGSIAAPTAGLHFTEYLLDKIKEKGIIICNVILNVGVGTFKPVEAMKITDHKMHSEICEVPLETAEIINKAKARGSKIIAVGTTTARTLESFALMNNEQGTMNNEQSAMQYEERKTKNEKLSYGKRDTDLFLYPGKEIHIIDGLITNFHMPASTLMMLVSAFAGYELIMTSYQKAIEQKYRFLSYGDAMLII